MFSGKWVLAEQAAKVTRPGDPMVRAADVAGDAEETTIITATAPLTTTPGLTTTAPLTLTAAAVEAQAPAITLLYLPVVAR